MTAVIFHTGKEIFLAGPYDKFQFAVWEPGRTADKTELPSKFTMEFEGAKSLNLTGREADEMRDHLRAQARK